MNINEKQYNLLTKLLDNYKLQKDIEHLTQFEASIAIEGMINNGKVKDTYKGKKLKPVDLEKKQKLFDSLVVMKNPYITDKQLMFIQNLILTSKYELIDVNIKKEDANSIISFLRDNIYSKTALKYLKEIDEDSLIKVKESTKDTTIDIPKDWILYDIEINGIIDF